MILNFLNLLLLGVIFSLMFQLFLLLHRVTNCYKVTVVSDVTVVTVVLE